MKIRVSILKTEHETINVVFQFHQDNYFLLLGCNIGSYVISKRAYPVKTYSSCVPAEHCIKLASGIRKVAECRRPIGCKQCKLV